MVVNAFGDRKQKTAARGDDRYEGLKFLELCSLGGVFQYARVVEVLVRVFSRMTHRFYCRSRGEPRVVVCCIPQATPGPARWSVPSTTGSLSARIRWFCFFYFRPWRTETH